MRRNGPFTAAISTCCRFSSSNGHINNGDGNIRTETIVDLNATSANPISSMAPIIDCRDQCGVLVLRAGVRSRRARAPLAIGDGPGGRRFAGGFVQPGPPSAVNSASIDADDGVVHVGHDGRHIGGVRQHVLFDPSDGREHRRRGSPSPRRRSTSSSDSDRTAPTRHRCSRLRRQRTARRSTRRSVARSASRSPAVTPTSPTWSRCPCSGWPAGAGFTTSPANPASGSFTWTPTSDGNVHPDPAGPGQPWPRRHAALRDDRRRRTATDPPRS